MVQNVVFMPKAVSGGEAEALIKALDAAEVGGLVVYHRGPGGSAPNSLKRAALKLFEKGRGIPVQRMTKEVTSKGERVVEYIIVKGK